jgi:hypothetical protein
MYAFGGKAEVPSADGDFGAAYDADGRLASLVL